MKPFLKYLIYILQLEFEPFVTDVYKNTITSVTQYLLFESLAILKFQYLNRRKLHIPIVEW